jgi:hypothetical protein
MTNLAEQYTEAIDTEIYWRRKYKEDLAKGRGRWEFGMKFTANQIHVWEAERDETYEKLVQTYLAMDLV